MATGHRTAHQGAIVWSEGQAREAIGKTVYSGEGDRIGKVRRVFLDDGTGAPEFLTVDTGLFGTSESFVPVEGASMNQDDISVPYGEDTVTGAPRVDPDGDHLDEAGERRLYEHYGRSYETTSPEAGRPRLRTYVATSARNPGLGD